MILKIFDKAYFDYFKFRGKSKWRLSTIWLYQPAFFRLSMCRIENKIVHYHFFRNFAPVYMQYSF